MMNETKNLPLFFFSLFLAYTLSRIKESAYLEQRPIHRHGPADRRGNTAQHALLQDPGQSGNAVRPPPDCHHSLLPLDQKSTTQQRSTPPLRRETAGPARHVAHGTDTPRLLTNRWRCQTLDRYARRHPSGRPPTGHRTQLLLVRANNQSVLRPD